MYKRQLLHGLLDITMLWPQTSLLIMYVVGFSTEYDKVHIFGTNRKHEILPVHTHSPVSYTHLDVYKRQPQGAGIGG